MFYTSCTHPLENMSEEYDDIFKGICRIVCGVAGFLYELLYRYILCLGYATKKVFRYEKS